MKSFPELLRHFLALGTSPSMQEPDRRRIWLQNAFYLIGGIAFIAGVVETFIVDGGKEGLLISAMAVMFLSGIVFVIRRKTKAAEFYLVFVTNISLFIFENHHGPAAGTFLFYFPFMLIIGFLADFKKPLHSVIHLVFTVSFIVAGLMLRYKFLYEPFPSDEDGTSFNFNFIVATLMIAAMTVVIVSLGYRQYHDFFAYQKERKETEQSLKLALREKETLLAEIHHRVKNNLAVISGLLNLQMNVVNNEYTRSILLECRNRVSSMALIHQKLYQHSNFEEIDFGSYASELVSEIRRSYPDVNAERIEVKLEAEHIPLSLTKAVPCGLILNELLSNCYKHAFPGGVTGKIVIRFYHSPTTGMFALEVEDNGAGLPPNFNIDEQQTLGMTIIQSLADQLDAKMELSSFKRGGTICRIFFKL